MRELVDATHSFGFEINDSAYSYAEIIKKRGEILIQAAKTVPFEERDGKLQIDKEFIERADACLIVLGVEATDCLVRNLQMPLKKDAEVNDALPFQAEPLLPFPLEDAVLDWIKVDQDNKGTALTFAAVKKETVDKVLKHAENLGIEPEILSTNGSALAAYSKQFVKTDQPHFIIHVGEDRSLFSLVLKGKLVATQGSKISMREIQLAVQEDINSSDGGAADAVLRDLDLKNLGKTFPKLSASLVEMRLDLTRNIFGLAKQMKGEAVEEALVSGPLAAFPNMIAYLLDEVEKKQIHPVHASLTDEKLAYYALPIGLALQGVDTSSQINFRQGGFAYPKPLKRILKPLLLYASSCLALSIALYFLGTAYFGYRENTLRGEYVSLLESMNKTYQEGEAAFAGIKEGHENYEAIDIKELDAKAIEERLDKLEKEIKAAPDFIALNPNIPRVSDVLAWLTSHPNVGLGAPHQKNGEPAISIENYSYTLVKRPEEKKRDAKYQAKVEIEFTSPSPKLAREFHDSLIAPNEMVDPKGEIKWSSARGKYKTAFFLKDKTYYPSQRSF